MNLKIQHAICLRFY